MTLSDSEPIEELESWDGFANALRVEDKALFREMLRFCYGYFPAMQARESPFLSEGLLMSILLMQHKSIVWFANQVANLKEKEYAGLDT
jgi:hypothetical protein